LEFNVHLGVEMYTLLISKLEQREGSALRPTRFSSDGKASVRTE